MNDEKPLVNISLINCDGLPKTASLFVEKIDRAIGGVFRPYQIRRVAHAQADAELIRTSARIEATEREKRALRRLIAEEDRKQENIESITTRALPDISEDAHPQDVEDDWIVNFFDKCRLISDDQMQGLWARILAGEANAPSQFCKRTVNLLASLDKSDADTFTILCGFAWLIGSFSPVILDIEGDIYGSAGIRFPALRHLDDIGLISLDFTGGFEYRHIGKLDRVYYRGEPLNIEFSKTEGNKLHIGKVLLTRAGRELAQVCDSTPVAGFFDYVVRKWSSKGLVLSSPYPREGESPTVVERQP